MVDSSNESLYHPEEEFDPNLRAGIPLQNSSEIVDVYSVAHDNYMVLSEHLGGLN